MKTLIVAPHPDDELLGCGGTLLRRVSEGGMVGWLLMTAITKERGWSTEQIDQRALEIDQVRQGLHIAPHHFYPLCFPTAELDRFPKSSLVERISSVFRNFEPDEVLLPHPGDVHSDHRVAFEAASACTKWFRYPSVKRVITYETPSETEFGLNPVERPFQPNLFINISEHLDLKLTLLKTYQSEIREHPFPRSLDTVRAMALLRGSQMGVKAAEAFQILRDFSY
jgi:LmbE family N-acetylglucosaminyl deacetylase